MKHKDENEKEKKKYAVNCHATERNIHNIFR